MDTCGFRATGPGEMTTIIGFPACGYYRLKSGFFGPLAGGVGVTGVTFGTAVIGDPTWDSTAALTMGLAISEPVSGAAIGKAGISFTTLPAGTWAPAFAIPTLTIRG